MIKRLTEEEKMRDEYEIEIDVSDQPDGVYFVWLQTADSTAVRKLIVAH